MIDMTTGQVVNNDYHRLTNHLETAWAALHASGAPDLYPQPLRREIDTLNNVLFEEVDNGVYRCGFARSQAAHEQAYDLIVNRLDDLEHRLTGSPAHRLTGSPAHRLTGSPDSDICSGTGSPTRTCGCS